MSSIESRVKWLKDILAETGAKGYVLGSSGGKDSVLVAILARMATPNVTGIIMPCQSTRNLGEDREHALLVADKYDIKTLEVDLTAAKEVLSKLITPLSDKESVMAFANINPRLRMITLYNYAQREGYLVLGTGNLSERMTGYFTKWGDGAFDINPIGDMTVREVYAMLRELDCPSAIIDKAPSAGLYEGQTDEAELGLTYDQIDNYLLHEEAAPEVRAKIEAKIRNSEHKRKPGRIFSK